RLALAQLIRALEPASNEKTPPGRGIRGEAAGGAALAQLRRGRAPLRDARAQGRDPDRRRIARARASPSRLPHEALAPALLLHPERRNIEHADQALPHLLGRRDVATAPLLGHQLVAAPPVDAAAPRARADPASLVRNPQGQAGGARTRRGLRGAAPGFPAAHLRHALGRRARIRQRIAGPAEW